MNKHSRATRNSTLVVLLLLLAGTASAERLVKIENFGSGLAFRPIVEFSELVLTVAGPCDFEYREVVREGDATFRLDETTIDGMYSFYLQRNEQVDPGIVKVLQEARQSFDLETPKALCRDGKLPAPPASQSGDFRVFRGRIIFNPDAKEPVAKLGVGSSPEAADGTASPPVSFRDSQVVGVSAADFVIADDLIVDGSACIGFDCFNGETFGFDTLRLKENNLRIKFDDTSTAASFPRNDWQLTANDSANGGASKFSIDDISGNRTPFTVEANARSHSLYVDDGGRIGSRTSTPSTEIHTIDGDTPTLRLQQDGSSGFAPQTWDVAGNETNFFVRDVTNGSALPFRIRPGAPTSSIFVDVDGDVGMGTSSPGSQLDIRDTTTDVVLSLNAPNNTAAITSTISTGAIALGFATDAFAVNVATNGNAAAFLFKQNGDLMVPGDVITSSCPTGCGPADFVFAPDYSLMALADLREYLSENKHLPNIPSADEMSAGVSLTWMQMRLLEKIEELTLYTLQQQALIEGLSQEVSQLRKLAP